MLANKKKKLHFNEKQTVYLGYFYVSSNIESKYFLNKLFFPPHN